MGKQERAARREEGEIPSVDPILFAAILIADGGGYRIAECAFPLSVVETYATKVSEPEVLGIQLAVASQRLEDAARGVADVPGNVGRRTCPTCATPSLIAHPSKPIYVCANGECRYRGERT